MTNPIFTLIKRLSEFRPRTPNGPEICLIETFLFAMSMIISASRLIVTISSEPMFTGPAKFSTASGELCPPRTHQQSEMTPSLSSSSPNFYFASIRS